MKHRNNFSYVALMAGRILSGNPCVTRLPEKLSDAVMTLNKDGRYNGIDNDKRPKTDYLKKITEMIDEELAKECYSAIWLSAYASNNSRSDFHWRCDVCYDECRRRGKSHIYENAHHANIREAKSNNAN